jgi:hypothetical protein
MTAIRFIFGAAFQRPAHGILIEIRPASLSVFSCPIAYRLHEDISFVLSPIGYMRTIKNLTASGAGAVVPPGPGRHARTGWAR